MSIHKTVFFGVKKIIQNITICSLSSFIFFGLILVVLFLVTTIFTAFAKILTTTFPDPSSLSAQEIWGAGIVGVIALASSYLIGFMAYLVVFSIIGMFSVIIIPGENENFHWKITSIILIIINDLIFLGVALPFYADIVKDLIFLKEVISWGQLSLDSFSYWKILLWTFFLFYSIAIGLGILDDSPRNI